MDTPNLLWFCSFTGLTVLVVSLITGAVVGGLIRAWSILSLLYSVQDRVAVVEGTLLREVKTRAANERFKRPEKDITGLDPAVLAQVKPEPQKPFWQNPYGHPRAYDGK